jgi:hypothetical protein
VGESQEREKKDAGFVVVKGNIAQSSDNRGNPGRAQSESQQSL